MKSIGGGSDMFRLFKRELRLILTDSGAMLLLLFAMLIYATIYSIAYGAEVVEQVPIAVVDEDNTSASRAFVGGLRAGADTEVTYKIESMIESRQLFYNRDVYGIVVIPDGFEQRLLSSQGATVSLILDGSHLLLYRAVLEQAMAELLADAGDGAVSLKSEVLYNRSLGYGSFVMPSIVVLLVQQTLLIGVGMVAIRRRRHSTLISHRTWCYSTWQILSIILTHIVIYGLSFTIILATLWQIFGFPFNGSIGDIVVLMLLYITASSAFAQVVSYLFKRREAPMLTLLWSSVPILLLAGVSYPKEAFPAWLYAVGRLFPSSSAVEGFISLNTMGVSLQNIKSEIAVLAFLAFLYTFIAIILENRGCNSKNSASGQCN